LGHNALWPKFRRGVKYALSLDFARDPEPVEGLKINPSTRRKCNPEQAPFYGARRSPEGGYFMNPDEISGLIKAERFFLVEANEYIRFMFFQPVADGMLLKEMLSLLQFHFAQM